MICSTATIAAPHILPSSERDSAAVSSFPVGIEIPRPWIAASQQHSGESHRCKDTRKFVDLWKHAHAKSRSSGTDGGRLAGAHRPFDRDGQLDAAARSAGARRVECRRDAPALRDPQPRRLRLMQAGQPPPLSWQQAVGQSIDALARRAARPAREFVADSAEAVVFMDRSELLACLARDWSSAAIATRWWWRSLVRDPDIARAVLGEWLIHLEYAPAALTQLTDSRDAITFIQKLAPVSASTLLVGILDRFGLVELRRLLLEIAQRSAVPSAEDENQELAGDGAPHTASSALPSSIDPFVPWVPEVRGPPLVLEQRLLLGIGLMLRRAPSVVRSQEFAQDVARWAAALPNEPGVLQADALSNQIIGRPTKNNENVYLGEDFVHAEPQSLQQPEPVRELDHRGRLAAGQHQRVDAREVLGRAYLDDVSAEVS